MGISICLNLQPRAGRFARARVNFVLRNVGLMLPMFGGWSTVFVLGRLPWYSQVYCAHSARVAMRCSKLDVGTRLCGWVLSSTDCVYNLTQARHMTCY